MMHLEAHYCIGQSQAEKLKFEQGADHPSSQHVVKWAKSLDPDDPQASRKILITPFVHFRDQFCPQAQDEESRNMTPK
jgi:hypothetical protein